MVRTAILKIDDVSSTLAAPSYINFTATMVKNQQKGAYVLKLHLNNLVALCKYKGKEVIL